MRPLFTAHLCPSLEDGNTSSPCHHCTVPAAYSSCRPAPVAVVAHHTRSYSSYDLRMISRRGRTEVGFGVLVWTWEGIRAVYERWYGAWALSRHEPSQWLQCGDTLIGRKTYTKRSYEIIQMHRTQESEETNEPSRARGGAPGTAALLVTKRKYYDMPRSQRGVPQGGPNP